MQHNFEYPEGSPQASEWTPVEETHESYTRGHTGRRCTNPNCLVYETNYSRTSECPQLSTSKMLEGDIGKAL